MCIFSLQLQSKNGFASVAGKPGSEPTQQQEGPCSNPIPLCSSCKPRPLT